MSDTPHALEIVAPFPESHEVSYLTPTDDHRDGIRQLLWECGSRWPTGWPRNLCPLVDEWFDAGRAGEFRIAMVGTEVVALCHVQPHEAKSYAMQLPNIVALPRFRGLGIGKNLMRWAVAHTAREGRHTLELTTWPENVGPINLYKRVGFIWIPGSEVDMRCFVPGVLNDPALFGFFSRNDWYRALRAEVTWGEDGDWENEAPVDRYRFEGRDGDVVEVAWERDASRLLEVRWQRADRARLVIEGRSPDPTRQPVSPPGKGLERVSQEALTAFFELLNEWRAPSEEIRLEPVELLTHLGGLDDEGRLTAAGLLWVGESEHLAKHVPLYGWVVDSGKQPGEPRQTAIALALQEITANVTELPAPVLRETVLNAFLHRDYRRPGPVRVRRFADRVEVSNPPSGGGAHLRRFTRRAGLSTGLELGSRHAVAVCLRAGWDPPVVEVTKEAYTVVISLKPEERWRRVWKGLSTDVLDRLSGDELMLLHRLAIKPPLTARKASRLCGRPVEVCSLMLRQLEEEEELLESFGPPPYLQKFWLVGERPRPDEPPPSDEDLVLKAFAGAPRARRELEQVTGLTRYKVTRVLNELRRQGRVKKEGKASKTRYRLIRREQPSPRQLQPQGAGDPT